MNFHFAHFENGDSLDRAYGIGGVEYSFQKSVKTIQLYLRNEWKWFYG